MPPVLAIANPAAQRGRLGGLARRWIDTAPSGADIQLIITRAPGDAQRFAQHAADRGVRRVIAIGGDGTVHEVANGLLSISSDSRPVLGVVPAGTGNDFAWAAGLPRDPVEALGIALGNATRAFDVARVTDNRERSCFMLNSIGLLLEGAINAESHRLRRPSGFLLYLIATLRAFRHHYHAHDCRVTIDGETQQRTLLMASIANGPRTGGGFLIAPGARPDDGRLEVLLVEPMTRLRMLTLLPAVMRGTHTTRRKVSITPGRAISIESSRPFAAHIDGELWADEQAGLTQLDVEIVPGALPVACGPDGSK